MSKADIDKGNRWLPELTSVLEVTKAGIICLTPENQSARWLLFEAGALSKTIGSRVCTYLLAGLQPGEVVSPLGDFQHTKADKEETRQMLHGVNKALGAPVSEQTLNSVFDLAWPKLEAALASMPKPESAVPPKRTMEDMVSEILQLARAASYARAEDQVRARIVQEFRAMITENPQAAEQVVRKQIEETAERLKELKAEKEQTERLKELNAEKERLERELNF